MKTKPATLEDIRAGKPIVFQPSNDDYLPARFLGVLYGQKHEIVETVIAVRWADDISEITRHIRDFNIDSVKLLIQEPIYLPWMIEAAKFSGCDWLCVDEDGKVWAYETKPMQHRCTFYGEEDTKVMPLTCIAYNPGVPWYDSLLNINEASQ